MAPAVRGGDWTSLSFTGPRRHAPRQMVALVRERDDDGRGARALDPAIGAAGVAVVPVAIVAFFVAFEDTVTAGHADARLTAAGPAVLDRAASAAISVVIVAVVALFVGV